VYARQEGCYRPRATRGAGIPRRVPSRWAAGGWAHRWSQESLVASHLGGRREDGPTVGVSSGEGVVVDGVVGLWHAEGQGRVGAEGVGVRGGRESVGGGVDVGQGVEVEEGVVMEGRGGGAGGGGVEGGCHGLGPRDLDPPGRALLGVEKVVVGAAPDLSWRRMIDGQAAGAGHPSDPPPPSCGSRPPAPASCGRSTGPSYPDLPPLSPRPHETAGAGQLREVDEALLPR
jgi:hypothetical protein